MNKKSLSLTIIVLVLINIKHTIGQNINSFQIVKTIIDARCGNNQNLPCKSYVLLKAKDYFKGEAVILSDTNYNINRFDSERSKSQYIPSINDVQNSEDLLGTTALDALGYRKRYWNFNRQYSGYVSIEGDTIIAVTLLDYDEKYKANKFFSNEWKYRNYGIIIPCLDCAHPSIVTFLVDSKKRVVTKL